MHDITAIDKDRQQIKSEIGFKTEHALFIPYLRAHVLYIWPRYSRDQAVNMKNVLIAN